MENSMEIIIIILIVVIFIANQVEKNKKNDSKLGVKGASNVVPKPNNTYQVNQPSRRNSEKAFRESSTYQTSHMMNEQIANREAVIDVLNEFNKSFDKKMAKKDTKKSKAINTPIANKKETKVEYVDLAKIEESVPSKNTGYGWGIFDDFAASDALYLARKDAEIGYNYKL